MQIPGFENGKEACGIGSTEVLCLMNMIEKEELQDDEEYDG